MSSGDAQVEAEGGKPTAPSSHGVGAAEDDDQAKEQFQRIIDRVKQHDSKSTPSPSSTTNGVSNTEFRDMLAKANTPKPSYKPPPLTAAQTDMKWEKNTTGFGKKYLSKFGFTGRLGAKETGVSGVIEVKVRPNQMGLGFGNFTEQSAMESNRKLDAEVRGKDYVPLERNADKEKKKKTSHGLVEDRAASKAWKLGGVSMKDADLQGKGKSGSAGQEKQSLKKKHGKGEGGVSFGGVFGMSSSASTKQVILDMRGAVPKHITDTATINDFDPNRVEGEGVEGGVFKPKLGQELLYNLNVIVDMDELHLNTSDARLESLQKRMETLASEKEELQSQAERDKSQLSALQSIHTILERMDNALSKRPLAITKEDILRAFRKVCVYYPEETKLLGLIDMIPTLARPLLEQELAAWHPKENPTLLVELYVDWMSGIAAFEEEIFALGGSGDSASGTNMNLSGEGGGEAATSTAYQCLGLIIEQICLSKLRRYLVNDWDVKNASETATCAALLKHVKGIFLKESFITLVEMTVLPKIATAVKYWNPTVDPTPIHEWVLPWVQVIGRSISTVFPDIRRKLASALSQWNPLDSSAYSVLHPWAGVFDAKSMHDFLQRNILPKLVSAVRDQRVEPGGQGTAHLTAVVLWQTLIPSEDMVCLLEGEFFPKWFKVLATWLATPGVDFGEVSSWYSTWSRVIPEALLAEPVIAHYFHEALDMMSAALSYAVSPTQTELQAQSDRQNSIKQYSIPPALTQGNDYFELVNKRKIQQIAMQKLENLNKSSKYTHKNSHSSTMSNTSSFKEVIEDFALQHNMTFLPKQGINGGGAPLSEDGLPLWVFNDRVTCYIDQNVLFAHIEQKGQGEKARAERVWQPIDLDTLLRMAS